MSRWPAVKAKRLFSALQRIGWQQKRQSGSHRTLARDGWPDFVFAFHDSEEIDLGQPEIYLRPSEIDLRGLEIDLRHQKIYPERPEICLPRREICLHAPEMYLRGLEMYLGRLEIYRGGLVMTASRFRGLVVAWALLNAWWVTLPPSAYASQAVREAMEHAGHGAMIAWNDTMTYLFVGALLVSAAGLALYLPWARWLFVATTVASVAVASLTGVSVSGPVDGTLGYLISSRRSPARRKRKSYNPATGSVRFQVRRSDALRAKDVLELGIERES